MTISIATATFFYLPFQKSLELISKAGYENIELDLYWKGGQWEIGQHLKGVSPKEAVQMVLDCGLNIASLHDAGGVVEKGRPSAIDPTLYEYLDLLIDEDFYIVLHSPNKKTDKGNIWWEAYKNDYLTEIKKLSKSHSVLIENLDKFPGYYDPLNNPKDLYAFTSQNLLGVNIDTGHFAADGTDIFEALKILKNTKAVHLNDHAPKKRHVYVGEGILDLKGFIRELKKLDDCTITLECGMGTGAEADDDFLIERLRQAKRFVEEALGE